MSGPVPHAADRGARIRLEGVRKQAIETGRDRLLVVAVVFVFAFLAVTARLVDITVLGSGGEPRLAQSTNDQPPVADRADVVDRNGMVLATSLPTASLYADPSAVMAAADTARRLVEALPGLDAAAIAAKLGADVRFVWLSRNLTPRQQYAVNRLGLPGLAFVGEARRVYPHGRTAAHVLGMTDVDGRGIAGVEHRFDRSLAAGEGPLRLSLDIRVQAVLREEVAHAVEAFEAAGAVGLILDVDTAEVLAMVSLPDFDPNRPESMLDDAGFNRATKGVYEVGSILKLFTAAMALDSGTVTLEGGYDASRPIRVARFTVSDFHGQNRWLSVPEIIVYSSNIGAARMGLDVGTAAAGGTTSRRFGMLSPAAIELPEVGAPLVPTTWREINTAHHLLRARSRDQPAAACGRGRHPRQRRHPASAHAARARGRGSAGGPAGHLRRHVSDDARSHAPRGGARHRPQGERGRLPGGRQDRYRREARRRPPTWRTRAWRRSPPPSPSTRHATWCWSWSTSPRETRTPSASPPAAGSRHPWSAAWSS